MPWLSLINRKLCAVDELSDHPPIIRYSQRNKRRAADRTKAPRAARKPIKPKRNSFFIVNRVIVSDFYAVNSCLDRAMAIAAPVTIQSQLPCHQISNVTEFSCRGYRASISRHKFCSRLTLKFCSNCMSSFVIFIDFQRAAAELSLAKCNKMKPSLLYKWICNCRTTARIVHVLFCHNLFYSWINRCVNVWVPPSFLFCSFSSE